MNRIVKMTAFALVILLGSAFRYEATAQDYGDDYYEDRGDVSYQTFYDELSPHGNWVEYPGYGYVWQPNLGNDFRPYNTGGHWVWSDRYEWVWVSDYDWGWAPFHYGRWFHDSYYGWLWMPGYEWSGAWVSWRDGGDYYGWAPLRPGISFHRNYDMGSYSPPVDWWSFTPRRYIFYQGVQRHCIDYRRNVTVIHHTTIINNYYYGDGYGFRSGPRRYDFERYTGRINPVRFRQSTRPGRSTFRDNEVTIYRPSVRQENDRTTPRSFERFDRNTGKREIVRNEGNDDFRNRDREMNKPSNEIPQERNKPREFERSTDEPRQPQQNGTIRTRPAGERRFDRNDNDIENGQRDPGNRIQRQERPVRTMDPVNNEVPRRQPPPQQSQQPRESWRQPAPQQPVPQQSRQFERRSDPIPQRAQPADVPQPAENPGSRTRRF